MTTPPQGRPDWMTAQAGGAQALIVRSYVRTAPFYPEYPPVAVGGYQSLAFTWTPDTDQALTITYEDQGVGPSALFTRTFYCPGGSTLNGNVPAVGGVVILRIAKIGGGADATGTLSITGHGAGALPRIVGGVRALVVQTNVGIAAGATATYTATEGDEGAGLLVVDSAAGSYAANIEVFGVAGWSRIGSWRTLTAASISQPIPLPLAVCRVNVTNTTAALVNFNTTLMVG